MSSKTASSKDTTKTPNDQGSESKERWTNAEWDAWHFGNIYMGCTMEEVKGAFLKWCKKVDIDKHFNLTITFTGPVTGKIPINVFHSETDAKIGDTMLGLSRASKRHSWSISYRDCTNGEQVVRSCQPPSTKVDYVVTFQIMAQSATSLLQQRRCLPTDHPHGKILDDIVARHTSASGTIYTWLPIHREIDALPTATKKAIFLSELDQCLNSITTSGIK